MNSGPDLAPDVEVTDLLPAGTTYQSHNASTGAYVPGNGRWTVGDLANGASATLDITARVNVPSVENFAQVTDSGAADPDSQPAEDPLGTGNPPNQDDEDSATVSVAPLADLSLTKTRTAGPDALGDTTFRISLTNGGPSPATSVEVTELPPVGAAFVGFTQSQGTFDGLTNVWTVGTIGVGATATLDVTYTIASFPSTNYAEVTVVTEDDPDSQPAEDPLGPENAPNQDDEAVLTVTLSADVSLTKDETASPQFVGDDAVFDLTVSNDGPDLVTGVQVTDALPSGLLYQSHTTSSGTFDPLADVWSVGPIASGNSVTLEITARVTIPGTIVNGAEVTASGAPDPDSTPANNDPSEDDQDSDSVTTTGGSLGDTVFFDVNADGTRDPGEPGIAGVDMHVTDAGPNGSLGDGDDVTLPTIVTDANGQWTSSGLGAGPYRVTVDPLTLPIGMTQPTYDFDGTSTADATVVDLSAGQDRTDVDFGYAGTAAVGDTIFLDFDGDGVPDPGEGLAGVDVEVVWVGLDGTLGTGDDTTYSVTSDSDGEWQIGDIPPGLVQVTIDPSTLPAGVANYVDPDGGNDGVSLVVLSGGTTNLNQDFGYLGQGAIGHVVFADNNHNGAADPGEGLPGIQLNVLWAGPDGTFGNGDDYSYVATTDGTGDWGVGNLLPGALRVDVQSATLPTGATNSVDPDGGADSSSQLTLAAGAVDLNQNFGYVLADVTPRGPLAVTGSSLVGQLVLVGGLLVAGGLLLLGCKSRRGQALLRRVVRARA